MQIALLYLALCLGKMWTSPAAVQAPTVVQENSPQAVPSKAEELFALANEARTANGSRGLEWDSALASAAMKHCMRMTSEGPIAHEYPGEQDLTTRTGAAGAHFSLIEENIAVGSDPPVIHQGWLDSPEHRANLLNPAIDHVGIAVVAYQGLLFAVADYERAVPVLTQTQVEGAFAELLRGRKIMVMNQATEARAYCISGKYSGDEPPGYVVRWQNPDVTQLPQQLLKALVTGRYRKAAVGSCPAQDVNGAFTVYRVAVLLYE